jgi:hypothetical protein
MDANDRQVGGTHYRQAAGVPQHWDLAIAYGWDAFQYQITKYVMRWKDKHATPEKRLEDLKKAQHFLEKYIAAAETGAVFPCVRHDLVKPDRVRTWKGFTFEGAKGDLILYQCDACGAHVEAADSVDPFIQHGACPGRNYVAQ